MICRAKSLLTKKFVYGGYVQGKNAWIVQINSEGSFSHILVDPETVEWLEPEKWIPVKEREPVEEAKRYFGETGEWPEFIVMIEGAEVPTSLFYEGGDWSDGLDLYNVTHWMPMPKPPKEVKK